MYAFSWAHLSSILPPKVTQNGLRAVSLLLSEIDHCQGLSSVLPLIPLILPVNVLHNGMQLCLAAPIKSLRLKRHCLNQLFQRKLSEGRLELQQGNACWLLHSLSHEGLHVVLWRSCKPVEELLTRKAKVLIFIPVSANELQSRTIDNFTNCASSLSSTRQEGSHRKLPLLPDAT